MILDAGRDRGGAVTDNLKEQVSQALQKEWLTFVLLCRNFLVPYY